MLSFQHAAPVVYRSGDRPWQRRDGELAPGQASFLMTAVYGDWALEEAQVIWSGMERGRQQHAHRQGTVVRPAVPGHERAMEFFPRCTATSLRATPRRSSAPAT